MARITTAQDILKAKGYKSTKFDTNGFLQAVGAYFLEHDVKAKLAIVSLRFLDVPYDGGCLALTSDERTAGWKARLEMDCDGEWKEFAEKMFHPHVVVDAPYYTNALALLQVMGGYVVEKNGKKAATVALI